MGFVPPVDGSVKFSSFDCCQNVVMFLKADDHFGKTFVLINRTKLRHSVVCVC